MQAASRVPTSRPTRVARPEMLGALASGVAGLAWLGIAAAFAWLVFDTPLLGRLVAVGSRDTGQSVLGAVAWAVALTAPACFTVLGVARLSRGAGRARSAHPPLPPVAAAGRIPAGCSVHPALFLPDGRRIPDVVVGPHGVAFFERLPPRAAARRTGDRWEVRFADRSWRPIENPLARAARDAERLRRHLEAEERDFVVRVHAAVLDDGTGVTRTEACAVVALDDVPAWIAALPVQRGLTPDRLAHLREVVAALA